MSGWSVRRSVLWVLQRSAPTALTIILVVVTGCSTSADPGGSEVDTLSAEPVEPLAAQNGGEVHVLPESLPAGYTYTAAEGPTTNTHPTFVGAVTAADGTHTLRISLRWRTRPGPPGVEEDRPAEPPVSTVGGRDVYVYDSIGTARVPFTEETDVWLSFDRSVGELPDGFFSALVSSLAEVGESEWQALVDGLR